LVGWLVYVEKSLKLAVKANFKARVVKESVGSWFGLKEWPTEVKLIDA
jgi:hypothetical protein